MSAGWVAAVVRARALAARCPGRAGAREIAASTTLDDALHHLAGTPYGRYARATATLPGAQRSVTATLLWHLRVLAGWLPRGGARLLRPLASGFEIADVASRLPVRGGPGTDPEAAAWQPYRLGALETAWRSLERAATPAELRAALAASPWGDPGAETPWALITGMRMAAARRTAAAVPSTRRWAQGRAALLTARERFVHRRPLPAPVRRDAAAELIAAEAETTRQRVRALRRHWTLRLRRELAAVELALEEAEHEEAVRRRWAASPRRRPRE
ncbi:hypothetical protein [Streptomyces sp. NTH33]|uniref:hypothetical protein n=1 Tax=Streptomyces sp. NTH33 TaxID=1735453 RepID=UPI0021AC36F4|nr:hypothetical protein [Streptomyces sp. NTH33]